MVASAPTDARVFGLDRAKHARLFARLFRRLGGVVLVGLAVVQLQWWSVLHAKYPRSGVVCAVSWLGLAGLLVGGFWLLSWAAASRYRLLLGPGWVASDSNGALRGQVRREEVAHLCEGAFGLVLVAQRGRQFRIPRSLDGYQAVRAELLGWLPLTPRKSPHFRDWLGLLPKLAILVLCGLVLWMSAALLSVLNILGLMALGLAHP